jgi:phage tail tape-measure protein
MTDFLKEKEKIETEYDETKDLKKRDSNPDPITGEPGSHPVGVATGGVAGGASGAAIGGAVGGPVGAVVGGAVGAILGGLAGKGVAETVDPTGEDNYWRENFKNRSYYKSGKSYDDYQKAYRYGWEAASRPENANRQFEEVEDELKQNWSSGRGSSNESDWKDSRGPIRDAYDRIRGRRE